MKKGGRQREKRDIRKICIKKGQENKDRGKKEKRERYYTRRDENQELEERQKTQRDETQERGEKNIRMMKDKKK